MKETLCAKCGSSDLYTKHIPIGTHITGSAREESDSEFIRSSQYDFFWKWTASEEHLHITCRNCQYDWRCAPITEPDICSECKEHCEGE